MLQVKPVQPHRYINFYLAVVSLQKLTLILDPVYPILDVEGLSVDVVEAVGQERLAANFTERVGQDTQDEIEELIEAADIPDKFKEAISFSFGSLHVRTQQKMDTHELVQVRVLRP